MGDTVVVSTLGKKHSYRVSGTVSFGSVDSLGFASIAAWDVPTAQSLLDREGRYDVISVAAKKGTTPAQLVDSIKPLLSPGLQVKDADKQAEDQAKDINDGMSIIRNVLLGFGAIALLVGGFVIFNTLSITVAQRTREFATLRTLGASRKQVMRSVRLEGLMIGLGASAIGIVTGVGIAKGLVALFGALGVELPDGGTVIATHTITTSLIVGTGVTLLASIVPARRATRVPPIAAVREGSVLPASRFEAHSAKTGAVVLAASLAALTAGMFAGGVSTGLLALLLVGGVLALFAAIALLAPSLVKPLTRVVGWPARRAGGVAGELAGANAGRHPKRTASTAAALMIGLTLVTVVAVLGAGINAGTKAAIEKQVHADHVIDGKDGLPFRASEGDRLAALPGVTASSHVRSDEAIVQGKQSKISGIDAATIEHFYSFDWTHGSSRTLTQLGTDGALVTKTYAKDRHLKVGSDLSIKTPKGDSHTVVVRGVYDPPEAKPLLADVVVTTAAFDAAYSQPKNSFTFLDADAGSAAAIKAEAEGLRRCQATTPAPRTPRTPPRRWPWSWGMLYVLLGFSVIVSLFGMVNTMVLSVFERTREIGMLRTIGMTRRQARRMIRHESVITALIGTALGLGLGLFLSAMVTQAVSMDGLAARPARPDARGVHAAGRRGRHRRGRPPRPARIAPERARGAPVRVAARRHPRSRTPSPPSGRGGVRILTRLTSAPIRTRSPPDRLRRSCRRAQPGVHHRHRQDRRLDARAQLDVLEQMVRQLPEREDVDEIEEQLQRADGALRAGGPRDGGLHRLMVTEAMRSVRLARRRSGPRWP